MMFLEKNQKVHTFYIFAALMHTRRTVFVFCVPLTYSHVPLPFYRNLMTFAGKTGII